MKTTTLWMAAALSLAGCTSTAGPFVTNVASAGPGMLSVEKCEVTFSPWGYYHVENGDCTTQTVLLERATTPRQAGNSGQER